MLCERCRAIHLRPPPAAVANVPENRRGGGGRLGRPFLFFVLHETRLSFLQSVAEGCHLCVMIRTQLGRVEILDTTCELLNADVVLRRLAKPTAPVTVLSRLGSGFLPLLDNITAPYSHIRWPDRNEVEVMKGRSGITIPTQSTGSSANMELARLWIKHCLERHEVCSMGSPATPPAYLFPTRLINVEDLDRPFLEDTKDRSAAVTPYVALSYSWGDSERLLTLKESVDKHRDRMPLASLPKTFRDAVLVTHRLGYKYIWIDALCIVQNCHIDMSHELSRMGNIYRFAAFTIYAERAASSDAGLFEERDNRVCRPCVDVPLLLTTTTTTTTGEEGEHGAVVEEETAVEESVVVTLGTRCYGPDFLKSRGWILQEEVLASRRLVFGRQMAWRCCTGEMSETEPLPTRSKMGGPNGILRSWLYAPHRMGGPHPDPARPGVNGDRFDAWYTAVQGFSDRLLSFLSDTLPAVGGLASLFAEANGSSSKDYLAGLWREDIGYRGLEWYVAGNDEHGRPAPRTKAAGPPSWSWASVEGASIKFASQERMRGSYSRVRRPADDLEEQWSDGSVEILEAACVPEDDNDPFGRVAEGRLRVKAVLKKALVLCTRQYTRDREEFNYSRREMPLKPCAPRHFPRFPGALLEETEEGGVKHVGDAALDLPPRELAWDDDEDEDELAMEVWCMLLRAWRHVRLEGPHEVTVLVLEQVTADPPVYKRLGLGFVKELEWFGGLDDDDDDDDSPDTGFCTSVFDIV